MFVPPASRCAAARRRFAAAAAPPTVVCRPATTRPPVTTFRVAAALLTLLLASARPAAVGDRTDPRSGERGPSVVTTAGSSDRDVRLPWYRTPWAYVFEALGGIVLTLGLSHWHARQLGRRSEELERAVVEKTAALQAANQRLAELAWRDELTGLHNRRRFGDALTDEWARARRSGTPIALMLVDIDHFKRLNDSLGHVAGDRALKTVASVVERCARRPGDVAARYGGDEFAVLLPGGRWEHVHALAEEIREAVEALSLPHPGHPLGTVTVSVGVTAVSAPEAIEPTLVDAADRALYRAKASGRNAVAA